MAKKKEKKEKSGSQVARESHSDQSNATQSVATDTSYNDNAPNETMMSGKSRKGRFRWQVNVTILSFFFAAWISSCVMLYCLVWLAKSGFDTEIVNILMPQLTFVLGVWLPSPTEPFVLRKNMEDQRSRRREKKMAKKQEMELRKSRQNYSRQPSPYQESDTLF